MRGRIGAAGRRTAEMREEDEAEDHQRETAAGADREHLQPPVLFLARVALGRDQIDRVKQEGRQKQRDLKKGSAHNSRSYNRRIIPAVAPQM
jgi:hypothetical protein